MKYFNATTGFMIVRSNRAMYRLVWAAISFITKIGGRACALCMAHVGGTT